MQGKSTIHWLWHPSLALALSLLSGALAHGSPPAGGTMGLPGLVEARPGALVEGAWVRYTLLDKRSGKAASIRLAVLDTKGKARWLEVSITDERRQTMVYRSLVEGLGGPKPRVIEAVVQPPFQRPLALPDKLARRQVPPLSTGRYRKATLAGREKIRTSAGTFEARRYLRRGPDGEERAWLSDQLAGWPLVRFRSPRVELDLVGHGTDAATEIRGQPVKLDPRMLRHLPQP